MNYDSNIVKTYPVEATVTPRVPDAVDELKRQVERLGDLVARAENRLASVLPTSSVENKAIIPPSAIIGESPLTRELFSVSDDVRSYLNRLDYLIIHMDL